MRILTFQVLDFLKSENVHVLFRGKGKTDPEAPSRFSEFFPIENLHGNVKKAIVKRVDSSRKWRNGVGPQGEHSQGEGSTNTVQQWRGGVCPDLSFVLSMRQEETEQETEHWSLL